MRTHLFWIPLLLLFLLALPAPGLALEASDSPNSHPLAVGSAMPDVKLLGEVSPQDLESLGLRALPCALSEIKAKTVIFMLFSMYCPHCQREAPVLNELNALIKKRGLDKEIKLIGVGAGNSDFEVKVFRDKYATTFPLFSDPDFIVHKAIGEVGTPFFYVLTTTPGSKERIIAQAFVGRLGSVENFLDQLTK